MRSLFLICCLSGCFLSTAYSQIHRSALPYYGLNGKVRSVKAGSDLTFFDEFGRLIYERHYHHINDHWYYPPDTVELYENFYTYDANDSLVAEEGSDVWGKVLLEYNDKHQLVHSISYDPKGTLSHEGFSEYDSNGNRVKCYRKEKGEIYDGDIFKYDEHNNRTEKIECSDYGVKLRKYTWTYNARNQVIQKKEEDFLSKRREQTNYKYSNIPPYRMVEERYHNLSTGGQKSYRYDSEGRLVEKRFGSGERVACRYSKGGNDTTITECDRPGNIENKTKIEHTYNNGHQLVKRSEKHSGSNYEVQDNYFDFDKEGNWLQDEHMFTGSDGTHRYILKREISYYYQ